MHKPVSSVIAVVAGLAAGLGMAGSAYAQKQCHHIQGRYVLTPAPDGCESPVKACYSGFFVGAGILSGSIYIVIQGRAPFAGLPAGSLAVGSYYGDGLITTTDGDTVITRNIGILAPVDTENYPTLPPFLVYQSDIALLLGGSGKFLSASGHLSSLGTALLLADQSLNSLSGEVEGEVCLEK